jgi:hypothetical protein
VRVGLSITTIAWGPIGAARRAKKSAATGVQGDQFYQKNYTAFLYFKILLYKKSIFYFN